MLGLKVKLITSELLKFLEGGHQEKGFHKILNIRYIYIWRQVIVTFPVALPSINISIVKFCQVCLC